MDYRFELPGGLTPEEERAVIAALEEYFSAGASEPSAWAMAGRVEATSQGALQTRKLGPGAWRRAGHGLFARRGAESFVGRGDAR